MELSFDALANLLFHELKGLNVFTLFRVSKALNQKLESICADDTVWKRKIEGENEPLPCQGTPISWKRIYYLIHTDQLANIRPETYEENFSDISNRLIIAHCITNP